MAGISSGAIEASKAVSIERNKILSVHVMSNANCSSNTVVIKIWDSRPETNGEYAVGGTQSKTKEILRVAVNRDFSSNAVGAFHLEQDLHGVMVNKGIFVEFVGSGNATAFVNYV
tara:strand:+ start:1808 stop:2152 length:345 start_codon:yes stop_codon:yes gene_type:complete